MGKLVKILNHDLSELIAAKWRQIPLLYKQSFIIIFIALNVVFLYHTVNFVWGNHDWAYINNKLSVKTDFSYSRFSAHLLKQILTGGYILPVWTNVMSFLGLSLAAVVLCRYWKLPKKLFLYCAAGLLLVLQPQLCEWLYFPRSLPDLFWGPFYIILALILLERAVDKSLAKKVFIIIVSIFLLLFAINLYPAIINAIAVIFLGRVLVDLIEGEFWAKRKYYITIVACILVSGAIYAGVTDLLKRTGVVATFYSINNLPLNEVLVRFIKVAGNSFSKIIKYNQYFFPKEYILLFFTLLVVSLVAIFANIVSVKEMVKYRIIRLLSGLLLMACIIVFANSAAMIAENYNASFHVPRIDFFSIPFMFMLFFVIIHKSKIIFIKNIALILCVGVLGICVIQNLLFQKVLVQGLEAEKMLWQRVTMRIEEDPNFNPHNKYTLVQIGNFPSIREKYYPGQKLRRYNGPMLNFSFDASWYPMGPIRYYYPVDYVGNAYSSHDARYFENEDFVATLFKFKEEIMSAEAWPARSSLIITGDTIIVVANAQYHEKLKKYLQDNFNNE